MKLLCCLILSLVTRSMCVEYRTVLQSALETRTQQKLRSMTSLEVQSSTQNPKKHLYRNSNNDQMNSGTKLCDNNYKPIYYNLVNELPSDYIDTLQVQDYDSCPYEFQKPLYMNLFNFGDLEEMISTLVQDWDSISCELELVKPIYYYRWNDLYVFNDDEIELPQVQDNDECGFVMPEKQLYYNDWNDEYAFTDGSLKLPLTKDPDACNIETIKKNFYYNKWNDDYKFTEKKMDNQVQKLDQSVSKCEISEMVKPIYKNTKNDGNPEEQEKKKKSIKIDDPYDIDFPDPFKEKAEDEEEEDEDKKKKKNEEDNKDDPKDDPKNDPIAPEIGGKEKILFMNYKQEISRSDIDDQDHTQGQKTLYSFIQEKMDVHFNSIKSRLSNQVFKTDQKLSQNYNKLYKSDINSKIAELNK